MMWRTVKLGDIAKPYGGNGFPKKYQGSADGDIPFLKVSDMNSDGNEKFMIHANNYVTSIVLREIKAKIHPTGTIIFPKIGGAISTNKKRILANPSAFDNNVMGVVPSEDVLPEYLFKIFHNLDLYELSNKAALPSITSGAVKDIDIPLPPLPVQKQIVEKLDAAFADIDKVICATEKNIENAEAIFKKFTDDLFLSVVGEKKTLKDVTTALTCGVAKRPNYIDKGIPFLSARNVKNGKMKWVNYKFISTDAHLQLTKYNKPELGDILYSRVGAGFGDAAIVDKNIEFSIFVSLTLIKPGNELYNKYLCHYLNSSTIKELAASSISGTGVGNLNVGAVRKFPISLPSFEDQQKVVIKIDAFLKKTNEFRKAQENKLSLLKKLKASILNQAFSGELTKDAA